MLEFVTKRGDDADDLQVQLKDGNGVPVDLTGVTTSDINFHIKNTSDGTINTVLATTIDDAALGKVTLDVSSLVAAAGAFDIEVEVTFPSTAVKSFPLQDTLRWTILDDFA